MYKTLNEKVKAVYDYLKDILEVRSIADFSDKIGKNRGNVSEIIHGKISVTEQFASVIAQRFPFINKDFLTKLDCTEMFNDDKGVSMRHVSNVNFKSPAATINSSDQAEIIEQLRQENARLNEQITRMWSLIDKLSK